MIWKTRFHLAIPKRYKVRKKFICKPSARSFVSSLLLHHLILQACLIPQDMPFISNLDPSHLFLFFQTTSCFKNQPLRNNQTWETTLGNNSTTKSELSEPQSGETNFASLEIRTVTRWCSFLLILVQKVKSANQIWLNILSLCRPGRLFPPHLSSF